MQKAKNIWNIAIIALLICGYSCSSNDSEPETLSLEISPDSPQEIANTGGKIQFTISTNAENWRYAISDGNWLTEKSRDGNTLSLQAAINNETSERVTYITFSLPSSTGIKRQIKISQAGSNAVPKAQLLDVRFKGDGTAEDVSPMKNTISTLDGISLTTLYSDTYQRNIARFSHAPGTSSLTTGYYKANYSSNQAFKNGLSHGHSLEAMFMLDVDRPLPNTEIKMFSSHESGGTGLMIGNDSRNNGIMFLPYVGSGYAYTNSNVTPQRGQYYHVVGIWDKTEGKSHIYVNGILRASITATGDFRLPSAGSNWFAIGADPGGSLAQAGWKGDVVIARIYDKALKADEVKRLWEEVKELKPSTNDIQLSEVSFFSKNIQLNSTYSIAAKGFKTGDKVKMVSLSAGGKEYLCNATVNNNLLSFTIPADFVTGKYRFHIERGSQTIDIGFATLTVVSDAPKEPKVIAHRGFWTCGVPQNSIASFTKAQELGVYGSEFDLWITTDGKVVVNHDPTISGIRLENVTYDALKDIKLSNNEKLPTLEDHIIQGKKDPSMKLILELKTHSTAANNNRVATAVVNMVKAENMTNQVEYIAFSLDICKKILELDPTAIVFYLNGDLAPSAVNKYGIKGIDYNISVIRKNKEWIAQAQSLGMMVNVWTVNGAGDIQEMIDARVDFISTDYPILAKQLINGY